MKKLYLAKQNEKNNPLKIVETNYFSQEEIDAIYDCSIEFNEFLMNLERIVPLEEAKNEALNYQILSDDFVTTLKRERLIRSYIMEFDVYLDHFEKICSDNGKHKIFENVTHELFDSKCTSYALACIMRNHVAHYGDIIDKIEIVNGKVIPYASKQNIIDGADLSATKKNIVENQDEFIDLHKVIIESFNMISNDFINKVGIILLTERLKQSVENLLEYKKRIPVNCINNVWLIHDGTDLCNILTSSIKIEWDKLEGVCASITNMIANNESVILD